MPLDNTKTITAVTYNGNEWSVGGGGISSFTLEVNDYDVALSEEIILADESHSSYYGNFGYHGIMVPNITPTILRQIYNRQKDVFISAYFNGTPPHFEFFTNAGNYSTYFEHLVLSDTVGMFPYGDSFNILPIDIPLVDGMPFVTTNNEWFLHIGLDGSDSVKFSVSIIDRASE